MTTSDALASPTPKEGDGALWAVMAILVVAVAVAPSFGLSSFLQSLVIEVLIFSILAMSLNLLVG